MCKTDQPCLPPSCSRSREAAGPAGLSGKGQAGQPGSNEAFSYALRSHLAKELGSPEILEEPVMRVQSQGSGVGKLDRPSTNWGWSSGQLWWIPAGEGKEGHLGSGCAGAVEEVEAEMTEVAFADYSREQDQPFLCRHQFFCKCTLISSYLSLTMRIRLLGFPVLSAGAVLVRRANYCGGMKAEAQPNPSPGPRSPAGHP